MMSRVLDSDCRQGKEFRLRCRWRSAGNVVDRVTIQAAHRIVRSTISKATVRRSQFVAVGYCLLRSSFKVSKLEVVRFEIGLWRSRYLYCLVLTVGLYLCRAAVRQRYNNTPSPPNSVKNLSP